MLSASCKYGLRAVVFLAAESAEMHRQNIEAIVEEIQAPRHFTAKILQVLVKKKIISSNKGPNGGFYMDDDQKRQNVMVVIEAIDGGDLFTECGLGLKRCGDHEPCPLHHAFAGMRNRFKRFCEKNTIKDLSSSVKRGDTYIYLN